MHPQDFSCCPCVACFVGIRLKPVAHSKIKLKQNTETAWNSFKLVSASLAGIFSACKYKAERSLKLFQAVSVFCFSFILECATGLSLNSFGENWKRIYSVDMTELYCIEVFYVITLYRSTFAPLLCLSLTSCFFSLCSRSLWSTLNHECCSAGALIKAVRVQRLPDEAEKYEDSSDNATDGLDVGGVFTAASRHEVVGGRDGNVLEQQCHRQLVVQRN